MLKDTHAANKSIPYDCRTFFTFFDCEHLPKRKTFPK